MDGWAHDEGGYSETRARDPALDFEWLGKAYLAMKKPSAPRDTHNSGKGRLRQAPGASEDIGDPWPPQYLLPKHPSSSPGTKRKRPPARQGVHPHHNKPISKGSATVQRESQKQEPKDEPGP